jgi:hypothetical protein
LIKLGNQLQSFNKSTFTRIFQKFNAYMHAKKQLSLFDLTMIVVSLVIGMGIFRTPVNVAAKAQIPVLFYLAWIIGGIVKLVRDFQLQEVIIKYFPPAIIRLSPLQ